MDLGAAVRLAVQVLGTQPEGEPRVLEPTQLEVAVLDRTRPRRAFRRLAADRLGELLSVAHATGGAHEPGVPDAPSGPGQG